MILDIVKYPSSILRGKSVPVQPNDESIKQLVENMAETMYAAPGIGLAAPQVGVLKRVVVIDISNKDDGKKNLIVLINPKIKCSEEKIVGEEGCLSIPEVYGDVLRSKTVEVNFFDYTGKERQLTAEGLLARVIQHEVDHLDGILFIDRMSKVKRDLLKAKLRKLSKLAARG